jgi:hypothetical protein
MSLSAEGFEVCNRLVLEAVNKSSISKLQLAKRFYTPIQLLTSLARYNENGDESPFIIAMKKKNVSFIKELVTWISRKDVYKNKECEPMVLIIIDQLAHHIPILEVIDYRICSIHRNTTESTKWLTFIAQFFIRSNSFTRQDKIVLLELIGAALIIPLRQDCFANQSVCGLECWREAMTLRYSPALGQPLIPKLPAVCVPSVLYSSVFESAVEVATMEEMDLLQEDFARNYLSLLDDDMRLPCVKRMVIQAHLVIRRISSQANYIGNPDWLYLKSLLDFADLLSFNTAFESKLKINTYLLILEELNGFDPKLIPLQTFGIFIAALVYSSYYFRSMVTEPPGTPKRRELSYTNLLTPSKFISIIPKIFPKNTVFTEIGEIVYDFLFVMDRISPQLTDKDQLNLGKCYYNYIRYATTERKTTVLHVAVGVNLSEENFNLTTIELILKLGADPNAIDEHGQTALHILAEREELFFLHEYVHVFQALVDAGTHLDTATRNGETVLSLLKKNVMRSKQTVIIHPYYESLLNTVLPLSCLAARVIRRHGIRFDEDRIPTHLQPFVAQHSAKGKNVIK